MISSVYTYYLSTYSHKELTRQDVHKKSELRNIYNNILKLNKSTPLYKLSITEDTQKYVIDLKENAIALKNQLKEFSADTKEYPALLKTKAVSSDESLAGVKYVGEASDENDLVELSVQKLASPQINTGNYLSNTKPSLAAGDYTFEIGAGGYYYEFHTSIKEGDTNESLQERVARLINKSRMGLTAEVKYASGGSSALEIRSKNTGVTDFKPQLFSITEDDTSKLKGLVKYLGMDYTSTEASNANVTVNGIARSVSANTFSILGKYEITLKRASGEGESVSISLEEDYDSVVSAAKKFVSHYNTIMDLAARSGTYVNKSTFLYQNLNDLASRQKNSLDAVGLTVQDNAHIKVEDSLLVQSIKEGSLSNTLEEISTFRNNLSARLNTITLDPMRFVNKTMISYPHPLKPFSDPYVTSIYSGMMYNGYI